MKKSAMLQAFRTLQQKPMLLLLLLPVQLVSIGQLFFLPDYSSMFKNLETMNTSAMLSFQTTNMLYLLASSVLSLLALAGMVVLMPPAVELLRDGAAGCETPAGWFKRGMMQHWWKPIVVNLIESVIIGVIFFALYILVVLLAVFTVPFLMRNAAGFSSASEALGSVMPAAIGIGVVFGLLIAGLALLIQSFLALFLPAMADRKFGDAFKLLFSRKNFRNIPRLLGGFLLISLVSSIINSALFAGYILVVGVPYDAMGFLTLLLGYIRSWPFYLGAVFGVLCNVIMYPFEFCVFQRIREEEEAALLKQ